MRPREPVFTGATVREHQGFESAQPLIDVHGGRIDPQQGHVGVLD